MKLQITQLIGLSVLLWLPISASAVDLPLTTRQQTVRPLAVPVGTRQITHRHGKRPEIGRAHV